MSLLIWKNVCDLIVCEGCVLLVKCLIWKVCVYSDLIHKDMYMIEGDRHSMNCDEMSSFLISCLYYVRSHWMTVFCSFKEWYFDCFWQVAEEVYCAHTDNN